MTVLIVAPSYEITPTLLQAAYTTPVARLIATPTEVGQCEEVEIVLIVVPLKEITALLERHEAYTTPVTTFTAMLYGAEHCVELAMKLTVFPSEEIIPPLLIPPPPLQAAYTIR